MSCDQSFATGSYALGDSNERARRLAGLDLPHVAPLNAIVRRIRAQRAGDDSVAWFDPAGAGIRGTVLLLGQDPSQVAAGQSGFISPDNPDPTAKRTSQYRNEAGLQPWEMVHWNVVPWFVGERNWTVTTKQKALPWLGHVLEVLPDLRAIILMGAHAKDTWSRFMQTAAGMRFPRSIVMCPSPHLSNRGIIQRGAAEGARVAFESARRAAGLPAPRPCESRES